LLINNAADAPIRCQFLLLIFRNLLQSPVPVLLISWACWAIYREDVHEQQSFPGLRYSTFPELCKQTCRSSLSYSSLEIHEESIRNWICYLMTMMSSLILIFMFQALCLVVAVLFEISSSAQSKISSQSRMLYTDLILIRFTNWLFTFTTLCMTITAFYPGPKSPAIPFGLAVSSYAVSDLVHPRKGWSVFDLAPLNFWFLEFCLDVCNICVLLCLWFQAECSTIRNTSPDDVQLEDTGEPTFHFCSTCILGQNPAISCNVNIQTESNYLNLGSSKMSNLLFIWIEMLWPE